MQKVRNATSTLEIGIERHQMDEVMLDLYDAIGDVSGYSDPQFLHDSMPEHSPSSQSVPREYWYEPRAVNAMHTGTLKDASS